ncbi:hypothetical protein TIFTF001_027194 [Ficus carica]|uniref:Uncharacterized protein n=1 Tax=Ficus carica TaxID=3494 RepID=A0AA88DMJ6_FICCA|nr:hypothetical protein TIFTF001_027194 [Ficus carica]
MATRHINNLLSEESLRRHGWASGSRANRPYASPAAALPTTAQQEDLVTVAEHRPPLQALYRSWTGLSLDGE